jgi:hypothetical protein
MTNIKKKRDAMSYQLAGMSNDAGKIMSPIQARPYASAGSIRLIDDCLIWTAEWDLASNSVLDYMVSERKNPEPELLFKFIKLVDAPPADVLEFANKWGVLGICKHDLPYMHTPPPLLKIPIKFWCTPRQNKNGEYWESVKVWHYYARHALAMVRIAANLHRDRLGEIEDWNTIGWSDADDFWAPGHSVNNDRIYLATQVNFWLEIGNVRPRFKWRDNLTTISFDAHLFGVLASQLLLLICRTKGLGFCSNCGDPFVPVNRRPKEGQRNYCAMCGRKAALRDAQRDRRRRLKEAQVSDSHK